MASGAVVRVRSYPSPEPERPGPLPAPSREYVLVVDDRAGQPNALDVQVREGTARVHDARTPLRAGHGCVRQDPRTVTCGSPDFFRIELFARGGDDAVTLYSDADVSALLGPGDDTFTAGATPVDAYVDGGPGNDRLYGGPKGDLLEGGRGRDALYGGAGDDELGQRDTTRNHDSDILDGGPGHDLVDYRNRTTPVDIDLERVYGQGERGENDTIADVEDVIGGAGGGDVLKGNDKNNYIDARSGRGDTIYGRGGDDYLWSAKRVVAGPGRDIVIYSQRGANVSCGGGRDEVLYTARRRRNFYDPDCELIGLAGEENNYRALLPLHSPSDPVGRFHAYCGGTSCRVTLTLRAVAADGSAHELIGRTRVRVPSFTNRWLPLGLSRHGRDVLRARGPLRVRVSVRSVEPKSRLSRRIVESGHFETVIG